MNMKFSGLIKQCTLLSLFALLLFANISQSATFNGVKGTYSLRRSYGTVQRDLAPGDYLGADLIELLTSSGLENLITWDSPQEKANYLKVEATDVEYIWVGAEGWKDGENSQGVRVRVYATNGKLSREDGEALERVGYASLRRTVGCPTTLRPRY